MLLRKIGRLTLVVAMAVLVNLGLFGFTTVLSREREREQDVLLPSNRKQGSLSRSLDSKVIVNVLDDEAVAHLACGV